ncbi:MAG: 2-polyprenyl-6-methoxyphenol hydroxylase-like oxidoreductase [Gammaproteobacteria bacterium]|nr:2-polyprenyl-6-methoxyphenol hydroxylase-like oxidoreductase [Gammaproteobacteria bacterium]NIW96817.1 2-polyprenyl-6-methoxyphenol hydroxylase-like oxidoreductase [Phycisphaerae bacterium]
MTQNKLITDFLSPASIHRRAIVIGGGIAGMLAGRVLADHFDQVILLERDQYPNGPQIRAGVPQARHVHILLLRGKQILEDLFPGLSQELIDNGAGVVRMSEELMVLSYHGWRVNHPGGLTMLTFTHPLLEWCLRRRMADVTSVRCRDGCRVSGLIPGDEGSSVRGVRCRFRNDSDREQKLYGELIVEASGRFSRAPEWLSGIGYDQPEESMVEPFLGYASRLFELPDSFKTSDGERPGWKALLLQGRPPDHTRGGVLLPVEGKRWLVTLAGVAKDYPPTDEAGFMEFARSLRSNLLYDAIKDARPLSSITGARTTNNRRRHYERLQKWPERFVVLGDAACVFNPVFAQGISVATLQAMVLDRCLREHHSNNGNTSGLARQFQHQVTKVIEPPWLMATTDDLRWPATEGGRSGLPTRLMHRYLDAVIALATERPEVDRIFAQVAHLLRPVQALFHPRIAFPVLARMLNPFSGMR